MNIECKWSFGEYAIRLNGIYLIGFRWCWRAKAKAFEIAYRLEQAKRADVIEIELANAKATIARLQNNSPTISGSVGVDEFPR
jgi:hypothetical protein